MITPLSPADTPRRRGRPRGADEGGVLGSDVFVSDDGSTATTTPIQAPLPTPYAAAAAVAAAADEIEVAFDDFAAAAAATAAAVAASPSTSDPPPPPPVSLASMVGDVFSWAAERASPPLQPGGSTGEAAASSESFGSESSPLSTRGALLLGPDGVPFDLRAVAWPGFDAAETGGWLRGLPVSASSASSLPTTADADARTQFARMRALGFTAVKFPFSMPVVLGTATAMKPSPSSTAPEVECSATPEGEVRNATAPASSPPTAWNHWPEGAELPPQGTTKCNTGAPPFSSSALPLARLAWAAARAAEAGLLVVLEDAGATAAEDPALWVDGWARVAAAVANAPLLAGGGGGGGGEAGGAAATVGARGLALRLLADPDALSLSWATPGAAPPRPPSSEGAARSPAPVPPPPSLRRLALAAMDSLSRVAPSALLLVPGGGQAALFGVGAPLPGRGGAPAVLTGAGFATDAAALAAAGIEALASADGFLTELVGTRAAYLDRVVLSPTLGVSGGGDGGAERAELPASQRLWRALDASFGTLASRGHCLDGESSCHRFAVVVGGLGEGPIWASERAAKLRSDLSAWLQPTCGLPACASAAAPPLGGASRPPVRSWSWGEWKAAGASSLLLPPSSDASSSAVPLVDWMQVEWLQRGMGLLPWTAAPSTAWREGAGPAPTDVLAAAGNPPSLPGSGTVVAEAEKEAAAEAEKGCAAVYSLDARGAAEAASSGGGYGNSSASSAVASVVLTLANLGRAAVAPPFVVSMSRSSEGGKGGSAGGYSAVLQAHGVAPGSAHVVPGGAVRATVSDPWSVLWPSAGSSVSVSLVVRTGSASPPPPSASASASSFSPAPALSLAPAEVSVNGVPCSVSRAADATASAEGEGFGGGATTRSVMQTTRGFPLQAV